MRTFIAVHLEESLKPGIGKIQDALRTAGGRLRYTKPNALHFTLAFLGEIGDEEAAILGPELVTCCERIPSFPLEIRGFGTFPDARNPHVFWVGVGEGRERLLALQHDIAAALDTLGLPFDRKPFKPHLTVARTRERERSGFRWPARLAEVSLGEMTVGEVCLVKSDLTPEGPVYTDLTRAALSGGN